jgi:hypothetical protein
MDILSSELHRKVVLIKLHKTSSSKKEASGPASEYASDCEIWAEEGKTPTEINLGEEAFFMIRTPTPDLLHLDISVVDCSQKEVEVAFRCKQENTHELSFCPSSTGDYTMKVKWNGKGFKGSPFKIAVFEKLG